MMCDRYPKVLLKIGEEKYLRGFARGELYFSHAARFRAYEAKVRGQGDRLEGAMQLAVSSLQFTAEDGSAWGINGGCTSITVINEPVSNIPVFCLYACKPEEIQCDGEKTVLYLSQSTMSCIKSHFPSANAVAIIKDPQSFIEGVCSSIGCDCKTGFVQYFSIQNDGAFHQNDIEYFKFIAGESVTKEIDSCGRVITTLTVTTDNVYRSLFCKDHFFADESEYRFVLPSEYINEPKVFPVKIEQEIPIVSLTELEKQPFTI